MSRRTRAVTGAALAVGLDGLLRVRSVDAGWLSGCTATPTEKSPVARTNSTSSIACFSSPGASPSSLGGSPPSARMFATSESRYRARISESWARVWAAHVRWAIALIDVSRLMRTTRSCVRSRVDPPAPYVTDTNDGCSGSSSRSACSSCASAAGVLGGKNSNDELGPLARMSAILAMVRGEGRFSG